jgi:hypothetical protein
MTPELKKRWTDALRSGQYIRAQTVLRTPCGYCCLGVLLDVVDPNGWTNPYPNIMIHRKGKSNKDDEMGGENYIADEVLADLGMSERVQGILSVGNDDDDWSFERTADWIDEH